jgi:hypothetical protein
MHFSPLLHGSLGIVDELIIVVQAALVVFLLVAFVRARLKRRVHGPGDSSQTLGSQNRS